MLPDDDQDEVELVPPHPGLVAIRGDVSKFISNVFLGIFYNSLIPIIFSNILMFKLLLTGRITKQMCLDLILGFVT
jgi:membrane-bound acyltransferase YfiQ involved in biofilm formation